MIKFSEELRQWRGERPQKQVHSIFGVPLVTYQKWEQGVNEPKDLAKSQIRFLMKPEEYRIAIRKIAQEMFNNQKQTNKHERLPITD